jgi:hypothetical protein
MQVWGFPKTLYTKGIWSDLYPEKKIRKKERERGRKNKKEV